MCMSEVKSGSCKLICNVVVDDSVSYLTLTLKSTLGGDNYITFPQEQFLGGDTNSSAQMGICRFQEVKFKTFKNFFNATWNAIQDQFHNKKNTHKK